MESGIKSRHHNTINNRSSQARPLSTSNIALSAPYLASPTDK